MKEFITEAGSIYWWISVVVVGIIINIIAGFSFKYIDSFLNKNFEKRRKKSDEKEIENLQRVKELKSNNTERIIQSNYILSLFIIRNTYLLFSVFSFMIIILMLLIGYQKVINTIFIFLPLMLSFYSTLKSFQLSRSAKLENEILWEARQQNHKKLNQLSESSTQ